MGTRDSQSFATEPAEELANVLLGGRPHGLEKALFVCSGSEAAEAAPKLVRQLPLRKWATPEAALHRQAAGVPRHHHRGGKGPLPGLRLTPTSPASRRRTRTGAGAQTRLRTGTTARLLAEIETEFQKETVVGGFLVHKKVVAALRQGSGEFNHRHTYQAHLVACAAALAVQKIMRRGRLVASRGTAGQSATSGAGGCFGDSGLSGAGRPKRRWIPKRGSGCAFRNGLELSKAWDMYTRAKGRNEVGPRDTTPSSPFQAENL
ncbi:hypothetical protein LX36DRAFT_751023 [Colletotrichum falcatum]|nr:hypothetical protein LX36DRAFT_751023 [Colletotrichum falcatum]